MDSISARVAGHIRCEPSCLLGRTGRDDPSEDRFDSVGDALKGVLTTEILGDESCFRIPEEVSLVLLRFHGCDQLCRMSILYRMICRGVMM